MQKNPPLQEYVEEFFLSEAVRNQDKGELQLTLGADCREDLGSNLTYKMEYGLTRRLQLSSETPYWLTASSYSEVPAGWSTTNLGLQYQIIRTSLPFALTAGMSFGIPVRHDAELEYEPEILAAKSFHIVQVHASFAADIEKGTPLFNYNLASVWLVSQQWFPTLEFNGRRINAANAFYATPGLYRRFQHRLEVGIGLPTGIGGVAGSVGIVGKMTLEIGGDKDDNGGNQVN